MINEGRCTKCKPLTDRRGLGKAIARLRKIYDNPCTTAYMRYLIKGQISDYLSLIFLENMQNEEKDRED